MPIQDADYFSSNLHFQLGFMKTFRRAVGRRWLLQGSRGPYANATDLELHDVTLTASRSQEYLLMLEPKRVTATQRRRGFAGIAQTKRVFTLRIDGKQDRLCANSRVMRATP